MNNNASIDTQVQGAPLSVAVTPQHLAVPDGWKLVPVEPTPEIIAGAAIASWPTATLADIDLARQAAPLVLMQMDMAPGTTVDALAGMLATMAPAYRAMLAAAPKCSPMPAAAPKVVADERAAALADQDQVPYLIYFDDADRKPEMVIGELRAQYRFKQISGSWNAHLFVKIASNSQDDKYPCVTLTAQVQPQEPEAAQQNGGLVRAALIDLLALEHHTFAGVSTFDAQSDCRVRFARARQALAAPVQPVAVLDGWKLVPVRMTPDMKSIPKEAASKWNAESIYGNLLEAAPAAPAAQVDAKDAERLRWLAETGARITWSMDGEYCAVWLPDERDGTESRPAEGYPLKCYDSWHRAIDAAIAAKAAS